MVFEVADAMVKNLAVAPPIDRDHLKPHQELSVVPAVNCRTPAAQAPAGLEKEPAPQRMLRRRPRPVQKERIESKVKSGLSIRRYCSRGVANHLSSLSVPASTSRRSEEGGGYHAEVDTGRLFLIFTAP